MQLFLATIFGFTVVGLNILFIKNMALLIIDYQNGFNPGGELAVKEGNTIVGILNHLIRIFLKKGLLVIFSRDWHPAITKHFKKYGGPWPEHCVADTPSAQFHPELEVPHNAHILSKGLDPEDDGIKSLSAFEAKALIYGMNLLAFLRKKGTRTLFICGLATDYCVLQTVLDARINGFRVFVIVDAIKAVDMNPGDGERAIEEMRAAGAHIINSPNVARYLGVAA